MSDEKMYIENFLKQIATQSNRGTAAPYFYVIRSQIEVSAPTENCDKVMFYDRDSFEGYSDKEAFVKELEEDGLSEFEIQSRLSNLDEYGVNYTWKESGMFLTETDANDHLKINHYHYSANAHTYVKHCWRAPEMEKFFISLFNYFGIDKGNLDLRLRNIE